MKLFLCGFLIFLFAGCNDNTANIQQERIPACLKEYSQKGNESAINELMDEYSRTIELVDKKEDIFLIKDIQNAKGDFYKIEDWVCRAQKKYGRP